MNEIPRDFGGLVVVVANKYPLKCHSDLYNMSHVTGADLCMQAVACSQDIMASIIKEVLIARERNEYYGRSRDVALFFMEAHIDLLPVLFCWPRLRIMFCGKRGGARRGSNFIYLCWIRRSGQVRDFT